jgi:SAM-dependent methyltransferase
LNHIMDARPIPGTILDYGCFCGIFLNEAKLLGWDSFGLEPMAAPAIYARARFGLNVTTGTLNSAHYESDFFDVVTAFQVFEHLLHPDQELEKIHRIVKPGGLVLIEVPNIDNFLVKLLKKRHRHFVIDHISFFSLRTLNMLLKGKGFRPIKAFFPTRILSVKHIAWWLERYRPNQSYLQRNLPASLLNLRIHINLRDIITVIAEKTT